MNALENQPDQFPQRTCERPLVLVTDDHDDTRLLFSTLLARNGYAVIEAVDGEQAVELANTEAPDLILMDAVLPRLDGLEATRQIREHDNEHRTPIVFVCGRAEPNYRATATDAGCDDFLLKPFDLELLTSVVEKYVGKRRTQLGPTIRTL